MSLQEKGFALSGSGAKAVSKVKNLKRVDLNIFFYVKLLYIIKDKFIPLKKLLDMFIIVK